MSAQHSPGPWRNPRGSVGIFSATGEKIGEAAALVCPILGRKGGSRIGETAGNAAIMAAAFTLLDLLALALPYVEEAADDAANKPASVRALARRMRDAIERAEGKP